MRRGGSSQPPRRPAVCPVQTTSAPPYAALQVPMPESPPWWEAFEATQEQVHRVAATLLELYSRPKAQVRSARSTRSRGAWRMMYPAFGGPLGGSSWGSWQGLLCHPAVLLLPASPALLPAPLARPGPHPPASPCVLLLYISLGQPLLACCSTFWRASPCLLLQCTEAAPVRCCSTSRWGGTSPRARRCRGSPRPRPPMSRPCARPCPSPRSRPRAR